MFKQFLPVVALAVTGLTCAAEAATLAPIPTTREGRVRNDGVITQYNGTEGRTIRAGTNGAANNEFRGFVIFDITGVTDEVSDANFSIDLDTISGSPAGGFNVLGIEASTSNGVAANGTFLNDGSAFFTASGTAITTVNSPTVGSYDFDVTSFIEARRQAGDDYVAFRIDETDPSFDGIADQFQFTDTTDPGNPPLLEITTNTPVPEPASVALLAAGGLMLVGRRRRA